MRRPSRQIGPIGTAARIAVGGALLLDVLVGHATGGWNVTAWLLALVVFPIVILAWHRSRARRGAPPLRATGPVGHILNVVVFLALYLTGWYAPPLEATSDAALIFYGGSMLVAACRGYAGCEVLAVSNWALGRDDQVGCALFLPVDAVDPTRASRSPA